jgi:hypothetical protein
VAIAMFVLALFFLIGVVVTIVSLLMDEDDVGVFGLAIVGIAGSALAVLAIVNFALGG